MMSFAIGCSDWLRAAQSPTINQSLRMFFTPFPYRSAPTTMRHLSFHPFNGSVNRPLDLLRVMGGAKADV